MGRNKSDFYSSCEGCGGSGREMVGYGEDASSGDETCPTCKGSGK